MLNVLKKKTEVLHRILNEINAKKKKREASAKIAVT
jgi:hypothetical protein